MLNAKSLRAPKTSGKLLNKNINRSWNVFLLRKYFHIKFHDCFALQRTDSADQLDTIWLKSLLWLAEAMLYIFISAKIMINFNELPQVSSQVVWWCNWLVEEQKCQIHEQAISTYLTDSNYKNELSYFVLGLSLGNSYRSVLNKALGAWKRFQKSSNRAA
jgi:hypothetical protein